MGNPLEPDSPPMMITEEEQKRRNEQKSKLDALEEKITALTKKSFAERLMESAAPTTREP